MGKQRTFFRPWRLGWAGLAATVTLTCGGAPGVDLTDVGDCPYRSAEAWQGFLERRAADPRLVVTCQDQDSDCDPALYREVQDEVASVFDRCAGFLAHNPPLEACAANLRAFTPAWMEQHDPHSYGFTSGNQAYFKAQEAPGEPLGMMVPPVELAAAVPDRASVEATARHHGWEYLTHDSALGDARTFVMIPDPEGRFDQWIVFGLASAPGGAPPTKVAVDQRLAFLAVQKKDAAGKALPRVRLHFRAYSLVAAPSGGYRTELHEDSNTKCYSCHPSGARQLIERRTPVLAAAPVQGEPGFAPDDAAAPPADFAFARLTELNDRLRSYGLNDWAGDVVVANHGPALGRAQGCTACHDGTTRGILTVSTSMTQLSAKIADELSMPPGGLVPLVERDQMKDPALAPDEESALEDAAVIHRRLAASFEASRAPALAAWLLETRCH